MNNDTQQIPVNTIKELYSKNVRGLKWLDFSVYFRLPLTAIYIIIQTIIIIPQIDISFIPLTLLIQIFCLSCVLIAIYNLPKLNKRGYYAIIALYIADIVAACSLYPFTLDTSLIASLPLVLFETIYFYRRRDLLCGDWKPAECDISSDYQTNNLPVIKNRYCKYCGGELDVNKKCTGCGKQFLNLKHIAKKALPVLGTLSVLCMVIAITILSVLYSSAKQQLNAITEDYTHLQTELKELKVDAQWWEKYVAVTKESGITYHKPHCAALQKAKQLYYDSISDLDDDGYIPCPKCYRQSKDQPE